MKPTSKAVTESLAAIPKIDNHGALRAGLANIAAAVLSGEVSAKESRALLKAVGANVKSGV